MKQFIWANAILELLAGVVLLLMPTIAPGVADTDAVGITFTRMYGGAALAIGYFAFQTWQNKSNNTLVQVFLKSIAVFHIGVTSAAILGSVAGNEDAIAVAGLHGVLTLITLYFIFKK